MNRFIRSTLAALVVATAGIAASAPSANAGGIGFELSIGGPGGGIVVRDLDRRGSRDHDRPVRVVFANERNCPVIGFRR